MIEYKPYGVFWGVPGNANNIKPFNRIGPKTNSVMGLGRLFVRSKYYEVIQSQIHEKIDKDIYSVDT